MGVGGSAPAGPNWDERYSGGDPLELLDAKRAVCRLPEPQRDGSTALALTPLELIDHLAPLSPPPGVTAHPAPLVQGRGSSETIRFRPCTGLNSAFPGLPTEVGVPRNGPATSAVVH